eukprot:6667735-Pyramimonas_sp.AAC.1
MAGRCPNWAGRCPGCPGCSPFPVRRRLGGVPVGPGGVPGVPGVLALTHVANFIIHFRRRLRR